jgi:hypothetical protein
MVTEFEKYNWKTFVILWCKRVFFFKCDSEHRCDREKKADIWTKKKRMTKNA